MLFQTLFAHVFMVLVILVNAGTQPPSTCFNPKLKEYASFTEFVKELGSKFERNDATGLGDPKDSAQGFVCAAAVLDWMKTLGTESYKLKAYNWTSYTIRVFGRDLAPGRNLSATGHVYNGKGYFFWRQNGICYMTRFKNNSSIIFNENIYIKDNQQLYGGTQSRNGNKNCKVITVDNMLCNNYLLSWEEEAYAMGKYNVEKMHQCATA